jgi:4'-phosphopantetheinyl transferase
VVDVLADELGVTAPSLRVDRGNNGKPYVARPVTTLRFSVSHAADATFVALAYGVHVGVDVEPTTRDVTEWALWRHVLSFDELEWAHRSRTGLNDALLRLWVAKEAILKAAGVGLEVDPRGLELEAGARIVALPTALGDPEDWSLAWFRPTGVVAAVACRHRPAPIEACD